MWVRLLKTPTTTSDPIAANDAEVGKVRILDFHIRSRDRLVFLFGVYQNKERHSGEWNTGEMPHGDCFFAIMDHFGEILDSVIFETEFVGATVVGTECRTFSV